MKLIKRRKKQYAEFFPDPATRDTEDLKTVVYANEDEDIDVDKALEEISKPTARVLAAEDPYEYEEVEIEYRDGAEGCIAWIEDKVYVPIYPNDSDIATWVRIGELPREPHPVTGKSYYGIWKEQCEILREALQMENGRFKYRLIVFCWMRGEGKSLLACLVQLWKFFNWTRQQIMLGANSRDQVKFVHFDIMRDIITNSPELLQEVGGKRNIQEKEIRLKDDLGNVRNIIRSISSFSGIVSNITGYTFSEIFDMKKPKFFVQLDGSIRNIPNALGVIDSTVSEKTHILYKLYQGTLTGKLKSVYFSYRFSRSAHPDDYWNPNMDEDQLNDYQEKFPFGEFERYFQNLWEAGTVQVFTPEMREEMHYIGTEGNVLDHREVLAVLKKKNELVAAAEDMSKKRLHGAAEEVLNRATNMLTRLRPVSDIYSLGVYRDIPTMASMATLQKLTEIFDTDWAVLAGVDFGDPFNPWPCSDDVNHCCKRLARVKK